MDRRAKTGLFELGSELHELVCSNLDACSLARLGASCKAFRAFGGISPGSSQDTGSLRLVERAARLQVLRAYDGDVEAATRHKRMGWLERLYVEESVAGFDRAWEVKNAADGGFRFSPDPSTGSPQIMLAGMGPKLLLSDVSTRQQRVLRWRLVVRGNTAVEFGVVPADMQYFPAQYGPAADEQAKVHKSLHKCKRPDGSEFRENVGFSSAITVGSMLPFKVPLMKGSVVEVLAARGRFEFLVLNPPDAQELFWSGAGNHARTVPKPYKGPQRFAMEQSFDPDQDVRLALTCWAQGVFGVLHQQPKERAPARGAGAAAEAQAGGGGQRRKAAAAGSGDDSSGAGPSGSAPAPSGSLGSGSSSGATGAQLNLRTPLAANAAADPLAGGKRARGEQQPQQRRQGQQPPQQQVVGGMRIEVVDLTDAPASPSDHSTAAL